MTKSLKKAANVELKLNHEFVFTNLFAALELKEELKPIIILLELNKINY